MFTLLVVIVVILALFGLGVLLLMAFVVAAEQMRFGLQVNIDAFFVERFGYVYLANNIRNLFPAMFACVFASFILVPLGFVELGIRYARKRFHKTAAPASLA